MEGFLSLPQEVIDLVGKQVISGREPREPEADGIRDWCRLASTCKELWSMQLPTSALRWSLHLDIRLKGESKATFG